MTEENANILKDNVDALVKKMYQKDEGVEKNLEEAVIVNGMCEGLAMKEERNPILKFLTYEIIDGEVAITDCSASASGAFEIPATIDGYPVISIGDRAFEHCSSLASITIPEGVTSIGDGRQACHGERMGRIRFEAEKEVRTSQDLQRG